MNNLLLCLSLIFGILAGYLNSPLLYQIASNIATITVKILQLLSLPILFLSIVSTLSGMKSFEETKLIGGKVLKYTLITTIAASFVALFVYLIIDPVRFFTANNTLNEVKPAPGYLESFLAVFPSNIVAPFLENNVFAIVLMALVFGIAIVSLEDQQKKTLHHFFSSLFGAFLVITKYIIRFMPIAVFAFITIFVRELLSDETAKQQSVFYYTLTVLCANIVQGFLFLPIFLMVKRISPLKLIRAMLPAINLAFFSKSSNATLPLALENATQRAHISEKVAKFSLPLCTTINMNGCAAFILITTVFVATIQGRIFTPQDYVLWVFISTLAAVGNAGIPMGCFFLSSAILSGMGVPLEIMGMILPIYSLIDMVETALNVWSDSCVTAVVDKEVCQKESLSVLAKS
ncbi:MAG: dicarboxylate/amino acid:cation symporter [Chlamydiae bacterium]|nr:dicarboxylate/amino acid:cation symporter [Chlamydiota bacterium]